MTIRLAIVGDSDPSSPSHLDIEAARALLGPDVETAWVATNSPEMAAIAAGATAYDGVWITPGSPYADEAAVLAVIRVARESGLPLLGTGSGMGCAVREFMGRPAPRLTLGDEVVRALGPYGWVVETSALHAADAPVEVLTYAPHPFFVLTGFQPQAGARAYGQVHPMLHAFVARTRHVAPARAAVLARRAEQAQLAAQEAQPRSYVHQLRGGRPRWWRPLISLAVFVLVWLALAATVSVGFMLAGQVGTDPDAFELTPGTNLWLNLMLAACIPAGMVATLAAYPRRWRRLFSVTGRFRWGWLMRCLLLTTPLWLVYLGVSWVLFDQEVLPRPQQWVALLVVTVLTTPLQAAGEEVAFRGVLVQAVGAWFRSPPVALAVTTVLSFALFAAAHGSMDPWIWIDLGSLAVAGCWLSWRTGGLEAAIALHVVNNLTVIVSGLLLGGLEESYVDTDTTGHPVSAALSVAVMALATALLLYAARRRGVSPAGALTPLEG